MKKLILTLAVITCTTLSIHTLPKKEALLRAVEHGQIKAVERLLKQGISPNSANKDGLTCMHYAAWHGSYAIVQLLFKYGARVNCLESRPAELPR